MLHGRLLPKKELYTLRERLKTPGLPPFAVSFMTADNYYLNCQSDLAEEVARIVGVVPPIISNIDDIVKMDVYQMCVYLKGKALDELMEGWLTGCTASVWNPIFADVNEKGITKAYGIDRMLEIFGLDLSRTLSFGDGGNDIPMLEHTALSVCMGNADDAVRAASDFVTETVDEDGVAKALMRLGVL